MSRLHASFVLGYHGCDDKTAEKAVLGEADHLKSNQKWDWLGPGIYFWEADYQRALEWARWRITKGNSSDVKAVGAVIDLRHCLDLTNREDIELVKVAYQSFVEYQKTSGFPIPENKKITTEIGEVKRLQYLDCAVLIHLHKMMETSPEHEPFDTVRGLFIEGEEAYPGCGFNEKNHIQIAVINTQCIRGFFVPREGTE